MKKITVEIPAIREYLNEWKKVAREYYEAQYNEMNEQLSQLSRFDWEGRNRLRNKYGKFVFEASYYSSNVAGYFEKAINEEAEAKYFNLVNKIIKICGEITDAKYLHIAKNGELNGYIEGTQANAYIETITAGGYNIQRFHFRTLVKKSEKNQEG